MDILPGDQEAMNSLEASSSRLSLQKQQLNYPNRPSLERIDSAQKADESAKVSPAASQDAATLDGKPKNQNRSKRGKLRERQINSKGRI
jgi:hypothetical protein